KALTADALGVINDTVTVGAVPISLLPTAFSLALAGPVGPSFLTWDTAPPAGFIGDALTPHTITGSPCGTNFFRVEGPLLPVGGVQTPLFVITGQKLHVCGNGVLDVGEQCDDGKTATTADSCSGGNCMGFISDAKLTLAAGENPSLAGFTAVGDARTDGTSVRVSLTNMDPARYPVGCAGVTVKVGAISATASVTPFAAQAVPLVRATAINVLVPGTVPAGSAVDFRVACT